MLKSIWCAGVELAKLPRFPSSFSLNSRVRNLPNLLPFLALPWALLAGPENKLVGTVGALTRGQFCGWCAEISRAEKARSGLAWFICWLEPRHDGRKKRQHLTHWLTWLMAGPCSRAVKANNVRGCPPRPHAGTHTAIATRPSSNHGEVAVFEHNT